MYLVQEATFISLERIFLLGTRVSDDTSKPRNAISEFESVSQYAFNAPSVRVCTQIIPSHMQHYVHVFLSQHSSLLGLTLSLSVI